MPRREQSSVLFTIAVSQSDWDEGRRGWRLSALRIPGAEVDRVFVEGQIQNKDCYSVWREDELIHWNSASPPEKATISIKLTETLSTQKTTDFWKMISALAPVMAALITVTLSYLLLRAPASVPSSNNSSTGQLKEPVVFNYSSPVYGECGGVTINGSIEMPAGSRRKITRLLWDWGDGHSTDGFLPVTHRYSQNEKYSAKVIAYAGDNEPEGRTIVINITNVTPECRKLLNKNGPDREKE